jgi:hypothetical protein
MIHNYYQIICYFVIFFLVYRRKLKTENQLGAVALSVSYVCHKQFNSVYFLFTNQTFFFEQELVHKPKCLNHRQSNGL